MACYSPLRNCFVPSPQGGGRHLSLPCGRCIGCRLERSRQWAVRLVHESKMHDVSSFITLTYDSDNLPKDGSISVSTCQLFLKRLRERIGRHCQRCGQMRRTCECPEFKLRKIRYFLCGEYGEKMGRPHYHAILFGYGFPDRVVVSSTSSVYPLFRSSELEDIWGHGYCSVGDVSFDSAAYVARYAVKKISGGLAEAHYKGRTPEFLLMSRRPGIGRSWIDKYSSDVYPSDEVISNGYQARPPRYYDTVMKAIDPDLMESMRVKREDFSCVLEEMLLKSGDVVLVAPSRNDRRLVVRERVAAAKLSAKSRIL